MTLDTNQQWIARSLAAVWHPCSQMKAYQQFPLLPVASAQGAWLYDANGRRYLDAISSWWVNLFGHAHPEINAALKQQLDTLEHVMLAGFTHQPVIELSEQLAELAPQGLGHCSFASDGAAAVEMALKMSAHYWRNIGLPQKSRFLSLENSYHGETLGALGVTDVALFKDAYGAMICPQATVPSPDSRLAEAGESADDYALRCVQQLERQLAENHQQIAALILEPLVQGAAGMAMYSPLYLSHARRLCDQYQVHLIADEIAVGMGRSGTMFACEQAPALGEGEAGIRPDFLCLSKGITGGYLPLSLVMTTDQVYQAFYDDSVTRAFLHSHSYTGNPLACRAALATLQIFRQHDVLQQNKQRAAYLNRQAEALRQHPAVRNWRQRGMIWAFEVATDSADFASQCFAAALQHGVLLRPLGNTVYFMPPYIINAEETDWLLNGCLNVLNQLTE